MIKTAKVAKVAESVLLVCRTFFAFLALSAVVFSVDAGCCSLQKFLYLSQSVDYSFDSIRHLKLIKIEQ